MTNAPKGYVTIKLDPDRHAELLAIADEEARTPSSYVKWLVHAHLTEVRTTRGFIDVPDGPAEGEGDG